MAVAQIPAKSMFPSFCHNHNPYLFQEMSRSHSGLELDTVEILVFGLWHFNDYERLQFTAIATKVSNEIIL